MASSAKRSLSFSWLFSCMVCCRTCLSFSVSVPQEETQDHEHPENPPNHFNGKVRYRCSPFENHVSDDSNGCEDGDCEEQFQSVVPDNKIENETDRRCRCHERSDDLRIESSAQRLSIVIEHEYSDSPSQKNNGRQVCEPHLEYLGLYCGLFLTF